MYDNQEVMNYEASSQYLFEQSNKRAWFVAIVSVLLTLLMVGALFLLMPLKTSVPFIVKVDQQTGVAEVITVLDRKKLTTNEAIDKHFVNLYVKTREGYYFSTLEKDYITIQQLSNEFVSSQYKKEYSGEKARHKVNKDNVIEEVKILSSVPDVSAGRKFARIRIEIRAINKHTKMLKEVKNKIITLSYKYYPEMELTEEERIINPLGFKVLSYRVDSEVK